MPRTLRFGIQGGPHRHPYAELRDYWREAEHLGYDWASIGDHPMPNPIFGAKGTDPWHEAWTTIAALAEATSTIHIGTAVGFRHPAILAKMAATLDVISGGRLEVGLGAGYLESEYRMYGLPFPGVRLAELNEAIQICKPLTQEHTDFNGKYFTLTNAVCSPKPAQRPHLDLARRRRRAGNPAHGRRTRRRLSAFSRGLHSPRSASTSTSMPGGTAGRSQRSRRRLGPIHAPGRLAGSTCQATGSAVPR
ncbi:MAG: LLM class flavin-dependent oxidoreductase [Thermomicrobiales bacterium]